MSTSDDIRERSQKLQQKDRTKDEQYLQDRQHELNQAIIREQHQLNLEIHHRQSKLTKWIMFATIAATLLGVLLGHVLQTTEEDLTPTQQSIQHEKTSQ